jgi:hypothetical protein
MSAKDFKSKPSSYGWAHRRDGAAKRPGRDIDLEETVRAGLKIYRFELTAAGEPALPFSTAMRGKTIN